MALWLKASTRRWIRLPAAAGLALVTTACTYTRGQMPGSSRGSSVPQRVGATTPRMKPAPTPPADSAAPRWPPSTSTRPVKRLRRCTSAEEARLPRSVTTGVEDLRWLGTDRYTTAIVALVLMVQMGCGVAVPPPGVPQAPPT